MGKKISPKLVLGDGYIIENPGTRFFWAPKTNAKTYVLVDKCEIFFLITHSDLEALLPT